MCAQIAERLKARLGLKITIPMLRDLGIRIEAVEKPMKTCHCGVRHYAKGFCYNHYMRFIRAGDKVNELGQRVNRKGLVLCDYPNCDFAVEVKKWEFEGKWYCTSHYVEKAKESQNLDIVDEKGQEKDDDKFILYADTISKMPYKEAHRGKYKGRWMREGLVELLFDCQYRANTIGNQLAKGLEWASKVIFRSSDQLIVQNVHTDMKNGEIIRSQDLQQIVLRMTGFDQLVNDWNRIIQLADAIANSYEVVTGESLPSGTPFRLAATLNINANKLFDFLREKLGLAFQELFQDWILPDLIKDLRAKEILKLTGDSDYLNRYYELVVNGWYIENLLRLPPHTKEQAEILKQNKLNEIKQRPEQLIELEEGLLDDYQPKASVIITGENLNLNSELETLSSFIALEQDPIRRTALIELAMKKKGIDVGSLPKSENVQTIPINNISQKAGTSLTQE